MSVTSGLWVAAYLRRCRGEGLMAVLVRRGAEEAGTIFVRVLMPERKARLFGPPAGPSYDAQGAKRWSLPLGAEPVSEADAEHYLSRQLRIDPDIWIVDVEDRTGDALLTRA